MIALCQSTPWSGVGLKVLARRHTRIKRVHAPTLLPKGWKTVALNLWINYCHAGRKIHELKGFTPALSVHYGIYLYVPYHHICVSGFFF